MKVVSEGCARKIPMEEPNTSKKNLNEKSLPPKIYSGISAPKNGSQCLL